VEIKLYSLA